MSFWDPEPCLILPLLQSLEQRSAHRDSQLSLLLIAFILTLQKGGVYELSCNSQGFLFFPFSQEIIWFYLETAGHMMEMHIWYKIIVVKFIIQYKSLTLNNSLQSLWIFFWTPILCVANQCSPQIKATSSYVNPSNLQNSTHRGISSRMDFS